MLDFVNKTVQGWKIEKGAGRFNIALNYHQTEAAMKHSKGKTTLNPCDLVMVKFHGIDFPASILVVLGIWPKDAG